jgi:parallel beta-helix repeat protein
MLSSTFIIQSVKAESGTIYIRADGSIDPPTAPILNVGNVYYKFTANIYESIVVERGNIVVDGASYTVQGAGSGVGILVSNVNNVTVKNVIIKNFYEGIQLRYSSNNKIMNNKLFGNVLRGIHIRYSSNNIIAENIVQNAQQEGIYVVFSTNNKITGNTITGTGAGIYLGQRGINVDCSNHNVTGNYLQNNFQGIFSMADNTVIAKNNIIGRFGITVSGNLKNTVSENTISGVIYGGIQLSTTSYNNITDNEVLGSRGWYGIWLQSSSKNIIARNNVSGFSINGIRIEKALAPPPYVSEPSMDNKIYHNNFMDNIQNVYLSDSINIWDDGYPSGGNYWGDYTGADEKSGPNQDQPGSDGIGDTPYVIDANNRDRYPLMKPWRQIERRTTIFGRITDGHGHTLSDVEVALTGELWNAPFEPSIVRVGVPSMVTKTNINGEYMFTNVLPSGTPFDGWFIGKYRVTANLKCLLDDLATTIFEVVYDRGPIGSAGVLPFSISEGESREINIDFAGSQLILLTPEGNVVPRERIPDMAAIYFHVKQVVDFTRNVLGVTLDFDLPIEIHAYSTLTSIAEYRDGEIYIGESISNYQDRNRPMNREWHEMFHEVMDDTIGIPSLPEDYDVHAGYNNPTTMGSWIEGWAEFWPCALARSLNWPNPQLYVTWYGRTLNFEYNWRVWDIMWLRSLWGLPLETASMEEVAVASLLWDVIDPVSSADDDYINLSIEEIWRVIGSVHLVDMRDVYERFVSQNIGSSDSDGDGISDLDELFIAHGFFADANENRRYDVGEEVGWGGRLNRRNMPDIPGSHLLVSVVDGNGNFLNGTLFVEVQFKPPKDIYNYNYEVELDAGSNLVGFAILPIEEEAIIRMQVKDEHGSFSDILIMENSIYWENVKKSTLSYAMEYTFKSGASDKVTVLASYEFDPDTLNLRSVGQWATVYIELPLGYNVSEIDISTVSISQVNGQKLTEALSAIADSKYGFVKEPEFYDVDNDGVPELMVKFDRKFLALLSVGQYTFTIIGKLRNGLEFKGLTSVRVINS